jgi:hypothetical protein
MRRPPGRGLVRQHMRNALRDHVAGGRDAAAHHQRPQPVHHDVAAGGGLALRQLREAAAAAAAAAEAGHGMRRQGQRRLCSRVLAMCACEQPALRGTERQQLQRQTLFCVTPVFCVWK